MGELIKLALSNFPLTAFILGLLSAGVSLALYARTQPLTQAVVMERVFAYFMLFAVGIAYLYNFVIHVFSRRWRRISSAGRTARSSMKWAFRAAAITGPAFFTWGARRVMFIKSSRTIILRRVMRAWCCGRIFSCRSWPMACCIGSIALTRPNKAVWAA